MNPATFELAAGLTMEDLWGKTRRALEPLHAFLHDMVHIDGEGLAAIYETPTARVFQAAISVDSTTKEVSLADPIEVVRTYAPIASTTPILMSVKPLGEALMTPPIEEKLDKLLDLLSAVIAPSAPTQDTPANPAPQEESPAAPPPMETPTGQPADQEAPAEESPEGQADGHAVTDDGGDDELAALLRRVESLETELAAKTAKATALEQKVEALSAENARFVKEARDAVFMAAIRDGRMTPAERPAYESWAAKDPEGFAAHLSSLTPTNPTKELGHAETNPTVGSDPKDKLAGTPWA